MLSKKNIRIGIDTRPLQGETKHRGIGKALENLIIALRKTSSRHSFVYYVDNALEIPEILKKLDDNESIIITKSSTLGRKKYFRSVLRSFKPLKPSVADVDIFYQYDASLGVPKTVPTVVVFHDLIPALFREQEKIQAKKSTKKYKSIVANEVYWKKYQNDLRQYRNASRVIAISESSRNDLLKYAKDITSVSVVYHGADGQQSLAAKNKRRFDTIISLKPFILYVGGIDYRKNISLLLNDFFEVKKRHADLKLVLIGKEFSLDAQLDNLGWNKILGNNKAWSKDIIRPGFVTDEELVAYYQNAEIFVFPSLYEGFGLPILEAMTLGVPVIGYSNSSIPEVAGKAALLVENGTSLASSINIILENSQIRNAMKTNGPLQAKKFTWLKSAQDTLEIIENTYYETIR